MRYWICTICGLVHSKEIGQCECGMSAFLSKAWVEFSSEEALKDWIGRMRKYMGAKLRYAGD